MATPDEAYGEGYTKGRKEGLAGNTAEAVFGMMKDDPGGHYGVGYRDGAAGKESNPPSAQAPVRKPAADVNPFDDKVAIKTVCPNCGALDWFEWKFLGRLTDPVCGHSWYVDPGTYTAMQVRAAFAAGGKGAKYLSSGVSGGQGAWIGKTMGWFMGVLLGLGIRLEFGVLVIPIQALAGLFQAKKTVSDIVARVIVLAVMLGGIAVGIYKIHNALPPMMAGNSTSYSPGNNAARSAQEAQPSQTIVTDPTKLTASDFVGAWQSQTSEVFTFSSDGGATVQGEFGEVKGRYSVSSGVLMTKFPVVESRDRILTFQPQRFTYYTFEQFSNGQVQTFPNKTQTWMKRLR